MTTELTIIENAEEAPSYAPHRIDSDLADASGRSLSVLIHRRQCYTCAQSYDESAVMALEPQDFIDQIAAHCAEQEDYLLPDTPIREAIFRALLGNGNEPMDAEQISALLTEKWAMTPFPRDTSPALIQRLMDNDSYYCVAPAPQPEEPADGDA